MVDPPSYRPLTVVSSWGPVVQPEHLSRWESALTSSAEDLIAGRPGESEECWASALARLTVAAAQSVPGAVYAGLTMRVPGGGLVSRAPSHEAILELDRAQAELAEGPCVEASSPGGAAVILVGDFTAEPRWPRFAPLATATGIASLLSYALAPHAASPGAINFYATTPHAFDDAAARAVAGAFAMQAAVAVHGARRIADLNRGLATRDVIGQAKGVLMERFRIDEAGAFELLVASSQDTNIKLVEVARWLVAETARRAAADTDAGGPATGSP